MLRIRTKNWEILFLKKRWIGLLVCARGCTERFFIARDEMTDINIPYKIGSLADTSASIDDHVPGSCHAMVLEKLEGGGVKNLLKTFF